jgi:uncharacterized protein
VNAAFVDTSGLLALLNAKDEYHPRAARAFEILRARRAALVSTSFVLVETYALMSRRIGVEAVRSFRSEFAPLLDIVWVEDGLHNAGLDLLLERRRSLSLVDAFAFDPHFEQEGFSLVG